MCVSSKRLALSAQQPLAIGGGGVAHAVRVPRRREDP